MATTRHHVPMQHRTSTLLLGLALTAGLPDQAHAARVNNGNLPTSPVVKNVDVGTIYMGVTGKDTVTNCAHPDANLDISYSNLAQIGNLSDLELLQQMAAGKRLHYSGTLYWSNEADGSTLDDWSVWGNQSFQGLHGSANINATSGAAYVHINNTDVAALSGTFNLHYADGHPETFLHMAETNPGELYQCIAGRGTICNTNEPQVERVYKAISGRTITFDKSGQETITNYKGLEATDIYQVNACVDVSPIVLDLSHTGKLEASGGQWQPHKGMRGRMALFDLRGNGMKMVTEWVGPKQGLLVEPRADGKLDGNDLFGIAGGYNNGFDKLSVRDTNHDGVLTGAELKGLAVWVDANGNGRLDKGELKSLTDLGITSLGVRHKNYRSTFVMNGKQEVMWDWWPTALDVRKLHGVAVAPKAAQP